MNYYNEFDPYAAAWLRGLMASRLIPTGDVDERSIADVRPDDLKGYVQCHFFAGIGGWPLALAIAGWPSDRPVWTGSCPCQPFSAAGKRRGFADDRHLWPEFKRLIAERRPPVVFGEQVASAAAWLRLVRGDLEGVAYAVGCMPIEAASAGADHLRDRFWFVADTDDEGSQGRALSAEGADQRPVGPHGVGYTGCARGGRDGRAVPRAEEEGRSERRQSRRVVDQPQSSSVDMAATDSQSQQRQPEHGEVAGQCGGFDWVIGADGKARRVKPGVRLLVDGFPGRVGLLRGFGNAIDPRPAAAFIEAYMQARRIRLTPVSEVSHDGGVFD